MKNTVFLLLMLLSLEAQAYVGPGMGAGTAAVVLGILGSIFLTLFAILWYPIKRLIKKIKEKFSSE